MKVKVTYTEVQTFVVEKEIEMSAVDYVKFHSDKRFKKELQNEISAECGDDCWESTECESIIIEKVNVKK